MKLFLIWSSFSIITAFNRIQSNSENESKTSLNLCISQIASKYYAKNNPVTISFLGAKKPQDYRTVSDPVEELIPMLSNTMKWSLNVKTIKKHNFSTINYTKNRLISKYFIIYLWDALRENTNFGNHFWKPLEAKFIVGSLNIFRNDSQVIERLIQPLWKNNVINGLVLVPRPENPVVFNIMRWYPFKKDNCGKDAGTIKIACQCSYGILSTDTSLFKKRAILPKSMEGCLLVAGYRKRQGYIMNIKNGTIGNRDFMNTEHGIEVNLVNFIARRLELKVLYIETPIGEVYLNGTVTGSLKLLMDSKIDIALAAYTMTAERLFVFDGTTPYLGDYLLWCVPREFVKDDKLKLRIDIVTSFLILSLIITSGVAMWLISLWEHGEGEKKLGRLLIWLISIVAGVPLHKKLRSFKLRMTFISLMVFIIIVDFIFQSLLISALANTSSREKYGTFDDIYKYNLTTYFLDNVIRYFQGDEYQLVRDKWVNCEGIEKCMTLVAERRDSALCATHIMTKVLSKKLVSVNSNAPLVYCYGNIVSMSPMIILKKSSFLSQSFDTLIQTAKECGLIHKWKRDVLNNRYYGTETLEIDADVEDSNVMLTLGHLLPVFLSLLTAHVVSFLVFILELLVQKKKAHCSLPKRPMFVL
ncbi:unnamed protein product [Phaedon cochleariae]|uniref:Ionotropic receptor n=1 Tax=Phaedon cochleariae TaxID=80249 RepID=A0A9N9SI86_PHACE|nr:unnamed protein product [Phaedon cochleariae]